MGVRRNLNTLSDADRRRWVDAVLRMKRDRAAAYNYDKFVLMHERAQTGIQNSTQLNANPAHGGPAFCPWHRYFIAKFEQDLQAADRANGRDGTIALPYWDWTNDNATSPNRQRGGVWSDDFLGGAGNPVSSGPFRAGQWETIPRPSPIQGRDLNRTLGNGTLPRDTDVLYALRAEGFDCFPYGLTAGTTGGVPTQGLAAPSAPALTRAAGGRLPAGTYHVVVTYVTSLGETRPSPDATITVAANDQIAVASPPAQALATGWRAYVSAAGGAAGSETQQGGTTAVGTAATVGEVRAGTVRPGINETSSFRNLLEGWSPPPGLTPPAVHNQVHNWVDGSMQYGTSPNDPVFFLHHCNIDRIWALWQFRHPGQNYPVRVQELGNPGVFRPHGIDSPMPPWDRAPEIVRPRDVLDHTRVSVLGAATAIAYDTDPPGVAVNVAP